MNWLEMCDIKRCYKFIWNDNSDNRKLVERAFKIIREFLKNNYGIFIDLDVKNLELNKEYYLEQYVNGVISSNNIYKEISICKHCGRTYCFSKNVCQYNIEDLENLGCSDMFVEKDGSTICRRCVSFYYKKCAIDGKFCHKNDLIEKKLKIVKSEEESDSYDKFNIHTYKQIINKKYENLKRGTLFIKKGSFLFETTRKDVSIIVNPFLKYDYRDRKYRIKYLLYFYTNIEELKRSYLYENYNSSMKFIPKGYFIDSKVGIEGESYSVEEIEDLIENNLIKKCERCGNAFVIDNVDNERIYCKDCLDAIENEKYSVKSYSTKFDDVVERDKHFQHCKNDNSIKDLFYGIEIETNVNDGDYFNSIVKDVLTRTNGYLFAKHDGSLDKEIGFELVSAPLSFEKLREVLNPLFNYKNKETKDLEAEEDSSTGIHIHISRTPLNKFDIARIVWFFNEHKNFCELIGNRWYNSYCDSINVKCLENNNINEFETFNRCLCIDDRYKCVNLRNRNTIEIRIFKSIMRRKEIYSYIEFVDSVVRMSKKIGIREKYGFKYMNPKNLKMLISGNNKYKFLQQVIKEKGL